MSSLTPNLENYFCALEKTYTKTCKTYPNSHKALGWASQEAQEKRFEILAQIAPLENQTILDVGCGQGHFLHWLTQHQINTHYIGIDLSLAMVQYTKATYPHATVIKTNLFNFNQPVDYIIASGVFNNKVDNHLTYLTLALQHLTKIAKKGVAFNLLSNKTPPNDQDHHAFTYFSPEALQIHLKNTLPHKVTLKEHYLPNDFTVYLT